jgi:hypothetical protein
MDKSRITWNVLDSFNFINKSSLFERENAFIAQMNPSTSMNTKGMMSRAVVAVQPIIVTAVSYDRFKIKHDVVGKRFVIDFTCKGERTQRKFSYAKCSAEEALEAAEEFRRATIKKMFI